MSYKRNELNLRQLSDVYKTDEFRNEWANDVRFHLGRNILYLRRYRGVSHEDLSRAVGVDVESLKQIECGQGSIPLPLLERIIVALEGRFEVSIKPQEEAGPLNSCWWEKLS